MNSAEIRRLFLDYFQRHEHALVSSGPLIPTGDSTLLFTNAGMVQFKDLFLGREKRAYQRATTSQCCIRAGGKHNDLENVGYTARHHTFFEMLGNFSFGDYFKLDAIRLAWNFLTEILKLPPEKLWITVYKDDDEAAKIWLNDLKVSPERFSRCGEKDNFWSMGDTGPCGPCTEIFYDHGPEIPGGPPGSPEEDGDRYIEIWNLVFMQFNRTSDGQMQPLPKPSVDTGMGLERLSAIMQGKHNNYDTDLFQPLTQFAQQLYQESHPGTLPLNSEKSRLNIIADHIRSSAFLIAEDVFPSNEGRGYVLRRIIRRALRHGTKFGIEAPFFYRLVAPLITIMGEAYPILLKKQSQIEKVLRQEEDQFSKTLANGLALLETNLLQIKHSIPGDIVFKLYDTYGFPVDLTADIAREKNLSLDMAGFEAAMQKQREMSQKASTFKIDYNKATTITEECSDFHGYEQLETLGTIQQIIQIDDTVGIILDKTPFYAESGGQVGDVGIFYADNAPVFFVKDTQKTGNAIVHYGHFAPSDNNAEPKMLQRGETVVATVNAEKRMATQAHHSATHLLHAALRSILGQHVEQKGSIVTPEKIRFDFSHPQALTKQNIEEIESWINEKILQNAPVLTTILPFEQAREEGAMALFGEKYGDTVRVLSMGDFSKELCGGTHAKRTGDIGFFKILSETGISAGVRRIEAVAGKAALAWVHHHLALTHQACDLLRCNMEQLPNKIEQALDAQRQTQKTLEQLQHQLVSHTCDDLIKQTHKINDTHVLIKKLDDTESKSLRMIMDNLKDRLKSAVIILISIKNDTMQIVAGISKDCLTQLSDAKILVQMIGEKGGGRNDLAQGGAKVPEDLSERLKKASDYIEKSLREPS